MTFDLYLNGGLVATSSPLITSSTAAFLSSGYSGLVDEVKVHETCIGLCDTNGYHGYYVMDDITYTVTPLPAALPLFATGLGALGLLGWRRKRKNAAVIAA